MPDQFQLVLCLQDRWMQKYVQSVQAESTYQHKPLQENIVFLKAFFRWHLAVLPLSLFRLHPDINILRALLTPLAVYLNFKAAAAGRVIAFTVFDCHAILCVAC